MSPDSIIIPPTDVSLPAQFEKFVASLFEELGMQVELLKHGPYDFIATAPNPSQRFAVDVKLYRSLMIASSVLYNAALRFRAQRQQLVELTPVLVTTALIPHEIRKELRGLYGIQVVGYAELRATVETLPERFKLEFEGITSEAQVFSRQDSARTAK